jgi:hypothetical protein
MVAFPLKAGLTAFKWFWFPELVPDASSVPHRQVTSQQINMTWQLSAERCFHEILKQQVIKMLRAVHAETKKIPGLNDGSLRRRLDSVYYR